MTQVGQRKEDLTKLTVYRDHAVTRTGLSAVEIYYVVGQNKGCTITRQAALSI